MNEAKTARKANSPKAKEQVKEAAANEQAVTKLDHLKAMKWACLQIAYIGAGSKDPAGDADRMLQRLDQVADPKVSVFGPEIHFLLAAISARAKDPIAVAKAASEALNARSKYPVGR